MQHDIARAGASISAREFGAGHAGNGATIVLMHGFPDNQHLYDRIAPALGESHHTVTFDFLGWGESPAPVAGHTYTFAELRADLDAVLAHFGATQIVPVVHDASGWPGIDWALDNPDSVAALVLLNTVYHPVAGQAPPNVIRAASAPDLRATFVSAVGTDELTSRALLRAQVDRFFEDRAAAQTFLPLFEHYAASTRVGIFGLTATLGETLVARAANVARMRTFSRPVTIAFGEADPYLNPTVARAFASAFPGARLELVPGGGHYVQLDRPNEVVRAIRAAVDGI
jgi:pimeloyl-ACP methyl ester carboxylesterase